MKPRHFILPFVFSVYVMLLWVLNPRLVLHLAQGGHSATEIGVFSAVPFVTIILMTPVLPWLNRRFSMKHLFIASALAETLLFGGYVLAEHIIWWYAIGLATGIAGAVVWTLSESMIALDAPEHHQGRFMGLYQTMMGGAMALGPILAAQLPWGLAGVVLLIIGCYLVLVGILMGVYHWPTAATPPQAPLDSDKANHLTPGFLAVLSYAWRTIPLLLAASLVGGAFEGGLDNLGIVISLPYFSALTSLYVPAMIALGSLLAQYPLGYWADRKGTQAVMWAMSVTLMLSCAVFGLIYPQWPNSIWFFAPVWGACGGSMYTLSMTLISRNGKDQRLVSTMGLLVLFYSLGKVSGPVLGGMAYDKGGTLWMGWVFALIAGIGVWASSVGRAQDKRRIS